MTNTTELVTKLTAAEVAMCRERQFLDSEIKRLAAERDALDEKMRLKMERGGYHLGTFRSAIVIEMRPWQRRTLDSKRLRLEQPAIAAQYERESSGTKPHYV